MKNNKKIVCLGGGIGTVNLIKGLRNYSKNIVVVVSMADEGGSSGRLRRMYDIFPPGDLVSCMAGVSDDSTLSELLTYRFPGDRYSNDEALAGHKLGNLIMVAMRDIVGNFSDAIDLFQKVFKINGTFLPATVEPVYISAQTIEGKTILGEENIDLGKYTGERILSRVFLHPENAKTSQEVIDAIISADVILVGPGDLYTTLLPVLIVPQIKNAILKSKAMKFFVINTTNKPFETKGYDVIDYISAIKKHIGNFLFDKVFLNTNYNITIPDEYNYSYVLLKNESDCDKFNIIKKDLVDENFPLYHNSQKLAKAIIEEL